MLIYLLTYLPTRVSRQIYILGGGPWCVSIPDFLLIIHENVIDLRWVWSIGPHQVPLCLSVVVVLQILWTLVTYSSLQDSLRLLHRFDPPVLGHLQYTLLGSYTILPFFVTIRNLKPVSRFLGPVRPDLPCPLYVTTVGRWEGRSSCPPPSDVVRYPRWCP